MCQKQTFCEGAISVKTITEFLRIIQQDDELKTLILEFKYSWGTRLPKIQRCGKSVCSSRFRRVRTKTGIATEAFWSGIEGVKFRCLLERKYGVQMNSENRCKIKDALLLYFAEG